MRRRRGYPAGMLAAAALLAAGAAAPAWAQDEDGPGRGIARISVINGDVSVRRGDSGDWVAAAVNAPLVVEDRISTGPNSRSEVQFDYANLIRLGSNSEVRFSELEYRRYQMQVARGTVTFRVLRNSDANIEISTPQASVRPAKKGIYRIAVHDDGQTEITVRSGEAEIYTPRGVERLSSGHAMVMRGTAADPEFQMVRASPEDDWDRWNERRDRDLERSRAYQYVSRDIYGAEDLDPYGRWVYVPSYGWCWRPFVAVGWAPYRYGRWAWVDWYGWTWVSYDPWGWAPYHYGRWFWHANNWCWWPGGVYSRHYWRPALVAFFGFGRGFHIGFGFGNVGWLPLAPYERYYPWYGRHYYGGYRNSVYIDRSVNIANNVSITNVYRNARVQNAISAVGVDNFSRGRFNNIARVSGNSVRDAGVVRGLLPVAPGNESLRFADREARAIPRNTENTRFYSRREPQRVERVPFVEQRAALERVSRGNAGGTGALPRTENAVARGGAAGALPRNETGRGTRAAQTPARSLTGETGAGWRRVGESALPRNEITRSENGWRRFGEPTRTMRESAPAATENGWRRLGESARPQTSPLPRGEVNRNTDGGNWRRFGDSGRPAGEAIPRAMERTRPEAGGSRVESDRSWRRFGEPASGDSGVAPLPRGGSRLERDSGDGWRRFERQPQSSPRDFGGRGVDRGEALPRMERRGDSPRFERGRPESIQVAPPVVRERSIPRMERNDSGFGRFGGDRPAPRMERPSGGGFGIPRGESRGGGMSTRGGGSSGAGRVSRGGEGSGRGGRNR